MSTPFFLGLLLIGLGAGLIWVVWLALRITPVQRQASHLPANPVENSSHSEAIIIVTQGGQGLGLNPVAREWFHTPEGEVNLEHLARMAQPREAFWELCAAECRRSFSLDGRLVDGTSYRVPSSQGEAVLVTLRRPRYLLAGMTGDAGRGELRQSVETFLMRVQKLSSNLEFEATLQAILEVVEQLIPNDYLAIAVWEADQQRFSTYRLSGVPGEDRKLEKRMEGRWLENSQLRQKFAEGKALLVADTRVVSDGEMPAFPEDFPYRTYMGVALKCGDELVAILEAATLTPEKIGENEAELIEVIAETAANALRNALIYREESQRVQELAGLAQLAQVVSSLRDPEDLFARLVESIAPLLEVNLLGFLIYDESRRVLEGQLPFMGLPANLIEWARLPIHPESEAEKTWLSQEVILASDARADARLKALGLDNLAVAVGIRQTVLTPLTSGGRMLGYLQVADKRDGTPFDASDLRLLSIIAAQAAPIIENAYLVQQSQRRAQRAETLRRIASLTGSSATLDEILKFSVQDLARLLQADKAGVFLLDESRGELRLHRGSLFGVLPELAARLGRLPTDDPQYRHTVTNTRKAFMSEDASQEAEILPVYLQLVKALELRSVIIAPLIVRERGIGEIILGSHKAGFFNDGDVQSVMTAASQLASASEQAKLYSQTDESLRRRVDQLTALTRISRELNSTLDLNHLIQRVYEEALRTTQADCGTILLFELTGNGDAGGALQAPRVILHLGDPPQAELHPLEWAVLERKETILVQDFEQTIDIRRMRPSELMSFRPAHAGIRSAMIVPIAYRDQVAGLIHLHARAPYRFDETARGIAETLAIQAAIALGNAHSYQEQVRRGELLNRRVETLAKVLELSRGLQLEQPLEESLTKVATAIQQTTPFDTVLVSVYDEKSDQMHRVTGVGISPEDMAILQSHPQSWSSVRKILRSEFCLGHSYFIPFEQMPLIPEDIHTLTVLPLEEGRDNHARGELNWHPEDMFIVPLSDVSGKTVGLISLDAPRDHLRPDLTTIETVEVFASQAAYIIESHWKLQSLIAELDVSQHNLEQMREMAEIAQRHLLLDGNVDPKLAIQRLNRQAERLRAGMDIAEIVNRQSDRQGVLLSLGRELIARLGLSAVLAAESSAHGPRLLYTLGAIPEKVNVEALIGQRNPLHASLQNGENELVASLLDSPQWADSPLLQSMNAEGFICLCIQSPGGADIAILGISREVLPPFTQEDEQLFTLLTRLTAITLQNLSLISETSQRLAEVNLLLDFSRQLGSPDPASILRTLAKSALDVLPQAETSLATLWDARQGALIPQAAFGYNNHKRIMEIAFRPSDSLPARVYLSGEAARVEEVDFARDYNLPSEDLLRYRDATGGRLPVSSLIVPIKRATHAAPLGLLVLENFTTPAAFTAADQALITSLTQQAALNLENLRLYQASERRADQLQSLTEAATTITANLQPEELIAVLLDQLAHILPYDTGTLWLRQGDQAIIHAARGFADGDERVGLAVALEDSQLFKEMIQTSSPISVGDIRQDERFAALQEHSHLSWLGVPLIAHRRVIGVIALEKAEVNFYTSEDVQLAATFAGQAAVALENARLFQESLSRAFELDQRSQRLEMLNRLSTHLSESLDIAHILMIASQELYRAIAGNGVSAIIFDEKRGTLLMSEYPQTTPRLPLELPPAPLFERLKETLGVFFSVDVANEGELSPLLSYLEGRQAQALLILPMVTGNKMHGVFLVTHDQPYRFSADEIGLGRTLSNQTAIAVQNANLFAETRELSQDLEARVRERTAELEREQQRAEILLRIITELSASLDLEQVLHRTLKVLNEAVDAEQITLLVQREGETRLQHLASVGYVTVPVVENRSTVFTPDQGLAGWVISHRQPALIHNILEDGRWVQIPGISPEHRSAIGVPLMIGAEALGALLLFHREAGHFSEDQVDLVQAAANQVAVAVNNAELYRLIRDQAEDLGKMLRDQQVEASRSRAILEAVADGVLVTNAEGNITLFNASAERTLGLERSQVIGQSLEHFIGLFGSAAREWMETIHSWSEDPSTCQSGDVYAEQITLEDGRVVLVHLAPVSLRNQFLGTVSIFRDITHQVEVDRLKSEFVATVSHELRTPMTSIKGYVDVLLMGAAGKLNEQQVRFLEIVKNNTERLTVLVNDLLDISRIETGRIKLVMQAIDLVELARQAVDRLKARMQEDGKPMEIQVKARKRLPLAYGDVERVNQILDNLLENAYYYTAENGQIIIAIHPVEEGLQVDVRDNGIGIPAEAQPRVFERFYRGDHPFVLATSGTGLGLSIVQHLVEMHNGRIWLESSGVPGEGSTFSFTLPAYKPEGELRQSPEEGNKTTEAAGKF